jgi:hypothetical protein
MRLHSHREEAPVEVAVGQQWGIFSRTVHRWAVATVISVENGTVNLKYRDYPGFCHLAAVDMLRSNDDLQFLEPLEEITPRQRQD